MAPPNAMCCFFLSDRSQSCPARSLPDPKWSADSFALHGPVLQNGRHFSVSQQITYNITFTLFKYFLSFLFLPASTHAAWRVRIPIKIELPAKLCFEGGPQLKILRQRR
jgi:hypothetical protein